MFIITLYWLFLAIVFFVNGMAIHQLINKLFNFKDELPHFSLICILGIIGITTYTAIYSFFEKIDKTPLFILLAITLTLFFILRKLLISSLINYLSSLLKVPKSIKIILSLLFLWSFFMMIIFCYGDSKGNDDGLYYMPFIKWINDYPVIPGLGNLHFRLATNSHLHVLGALFNFAFTTNYYFDDLNGFIYLLALLFALGGVKNLMEKKYEISNIIRALILIPTHFTVWYTQFNALQADVPIAYFTLIIISLLLMKLEKNELFKLDFPLVLLVLTPIFLLTIKSSELPFILLSFSILIGFILSKNYLITIKFIIIIFIIIAPWLIRNIILSGYLISFFPTLDLFNFDWEMSKVILSNNAQWMKSWVIIPYINPTIVFKMSIIEMYKIWFFQLELLDKILILMSSLTLFVGCIYYNFIFIKNKLYNDIKSNNGIGYLVLFNILLVWFIIWLYMAPNPRYGYGFIFFLSAFGLAIILKKILLNIPYFNYLIPILIFINIFIYVRIGDVKYIAKFYFSMPVNNFKKQVNLKTSIINGIKIYSPTNKNLCNDACWGSPLPCTPELNNNLQLRGTSFKQGFKLKNENY